MDNQFFIDSEYLSQQAVEKKHSLENNPESRTNHMEYMKGMEQIESDVMETVLSQMKSYDYSSYTAKDVIKALEHEVCTIDDFKALLSPAAEPFLEQMAQKASVETRKHFGNTVYIFTPLYIANYCENYCVYCGFNCYNHINSVIFPACFTYGINPDAGPNLLFVTMTMVFSNMSFGAFWGALFFLFMLIAAVSTLIAVFENIIAANLELFKIDRKKAVLINFIVILGLSVLPVLGFNVLSDVHIIGSNTGITDFCDFLISNNILPIGSLVFVLFVTSKSGMKWDRYIQETNVGEGFKLTPKLFFYYRYILTTVIAVLLIIGYYTVFNRA